MVRYRLPHEKIRELADGIRSAAEIAAILNLENCRGVEGYLRLANLPRRKPGPPTGERNGFWSGGRFVDRDGYVLIRKPDHPFARKSGYILEHRVVMEGMIGRYLQPAEVVDHIDGNTLNNSPENLRLFSSNSTHLKQTLSGLIPSWSEEGQKNFVGKGKKVVRRIDKYGRDKKQGEIRRQRILQHCASLEKSGALPSEMVPYISEGTDQNAHKTKRNLNPEVQQLEQRRARFRRK